MAEKDIIKMTRGELRRLHIIYKVIEKELTQIEAADILGLSERQIRRITKRVSAEGEKGIIHCLRGKPSSQRIQKETKDKAINLYKGKYQGFVSTLVNEKLFEIDKIKLSDETLREWLIEEGEWKRSRKHRKHRKWRERKHYFGQMIQMDGSHHDWLEGKCSKLVLMGYIDDATNTVFARFYDYEGTIPAMDSFRGYIEQYGIPQSLYLDKHSTYKSNAKITVEEELEGKREPKSQFERVLDELGVEVIHANSPQAKGRIERLFRTFQDRVIKEMRLVGIDTKEEANKFLEGYLPLYNKRFSIVLSRESNLHRRLPVEMNLDSILSIKTKRVLRNDFTITHNKQLYQIEDIPLNTRVNAVWID
ncbi:MAG: ISNCY family transposase [Nitrospirota bacterium]